MNNAMKAHILSIHQKLKAGKLITFSRITLILHQFISWNRDLEKLRVTQLVKKYSPFYGT